MICIVQWEDNIMSFINDESGATAIEYGLLTGFWFGLIITAYGLMYSSIGVSMETLVEALSVA